MIFFSVNVTIMLDHLNLLWSSIFVTFVAKKIHWIVAWILPGVSRVCKGCFAPPLAALSLTYTEHSR